MWRGPWLVLNLVIKLSIVRPWQIRAGARLDQPLLMRPRTEDAVEIEKGARTLGSGVLLRSRHGSPLKKKLPQLPQPHSFISICSLASFFFSSRPFGTSHQATTHHHYPCGGRLALALPCVHSQMHDTLSLAPLRLSQLLAHPALIIAVIGNPWQSSSPGLGSLPAPH